MADTSPARLCGLAPELERRVGVIIERLAAVLAWLGGIILLALVIMSVISISGRGLAGFSRSLAVGWAGPVPGDFELVEAGTAVAVFAFLPWCQIRRGHVTVDVFLFWASPRTRATLTLIGNILMTLAAAFIAWRLQAGLADKLRYGETSMILQMPSWYGYALALVGACAFALAAAYTVWRSLNEVAAGRERDQ